MISVLAHWEMHGQWIFFNKYDIDMVRYCTCRKHLKFRDLLGGKGHLVQQLAMS